MKIIINEELLKKIIEEELGIADNVVKLTNKIADIVIQEIDNGETHFTFTVEDSLKIEAVNIVMNSSEEMRKWLDANIKKIKNGFSFEENKIYLTFLNLKNDFKYDYLYNTIQHEVEHYWLCKNSGKSFSNRQYQTIASLLTDWNKKVSVIANVLYYTKDIEIDANINGAYAELNNMPDCKTYEEFKNNTELKLLFDKLNYLRAQVSSWNYDSIDTLRSIQLISRFYTFKSKNYRKELIKIIDDGIKKYIQKSSRAFALYRKEKDNRQISKSEIAERYFNDPLMRFSNDLFD